MAAELGDRFDLGSALTRGLVPLVWSSPEPEDVLKAYVGLYLKEEVQLESLVRRFEGFARFLEAVSFSHGAVLNVSEVARECQVSRKTVEGYLAILGDLLLAFQVPVFAKRAWRHLTAHPKFFWFDAGVFTALRPAGPLDRPEEIAGAALAGLVAQHLRAWIDYSGEDYALSFWRTKAGTEVDFVVYGRRGFCALEVKHSASSSGGPPRPQGVPRRLSRGRAAAALPRRRSPRDRRHPVYPVRGLPETPDSRPAAPLTKTAPAYGTSCIQSPAGARWSSGS